MNDSLLKANLLETSVTEVVENMIMAKPDVNEKLVESDATFNSLMTASIEPELILTKASQANFSTEDLFRPQTVETSSLNFEENFREPQPNLPPVQTVDFVDLERYDGLWYEVARTRNLFQLGCTNTTATYEILSDSSISVFNSCNRFFSRGPQTTIEGVANVVDPESNAKLEVNFEGIPFPGDYWIIDLVEDTPQGDYTYAVVGEPTRSTVFILSRTPKADPEILDELYAGLEEQFYDTDELIRSPQSQRGKDSSLDSHDSKYQDHTLDQDLLVINDEIPGGFEGISETPLLENQTGYFSEKVAVDNLALVEPDLFVF